MYFLWWWQESVLISISMTSNHVPVATWRTVPLATWHNAWTLHSDDFQVLSSMVTLHSFTIRINTKRSKTLKIPHFGNVLRHYRHLIRLDLGSKNFDTFRKDIYGYEHSGVGPLAASLSVLSSLQELHFDACDFTPTDMKLLLKSLVGKDLIVIEMGASQSLFTDQMMEDGSVEFQSTSIYETEWEDVLLTNPRLRYLGLKRWGEWALKAILSALSHQKLKHLEYLDLSCNFIGDKNVKRLTDQCMNGNAWSQMISLNMASNAIGEKGLYALADAMSLWTHMKDLNLSNNFLRDKELIHLSHSFSLWKEIETLDLHSNHLGRQGIKALLDSMSQWTKIRRLDISSNRDRTHWRYWVNSCRWYWDDIGRSLAEMGVTGVRAFTDWDTKRIHHDVQGTGRSFFYLYTDQTHSTFRMFCGRWITFLVSLRNTRAHFFYVIIKFYIIKVQIFHFHG